jgi:hypothetical protein
VLAAHRDGPELGAAATVLDGGCGSLAELPVVSQAPRNGGSWMALTTSVTAHATKSTKTIPTIQNVVPMTHPSASCISKGDATWEKLRNRE